jgi:hypothetical protein
MWWKGKNRNMNINNYQWKIKGAIQRLHKRYYKNPYVFISEADVQCCLYAELIKYMKKARKTAVRDRADKKVREHQFQVLTIPLHAEISYSRRARTEFTDLCIIDPSKFTFWIKKSKFSGHSKDMSIGDWDMGRKHSIGIEIKFNRWIVKMERFSHKSMRKSITQRWRGFKTSLVRDMNKMKKYKRGWLILVDQHSLIKNYAEWRGFVDNIIRMSNYGYAKKTLDAYYLCPKLKRALSYRPASSFY